MSRAALVFFLALGMATRAEGQRPSITVTGMRNLTFGTLIPGVPSAVPPTDRSRAARFDVRGDRTQALQLVFALPLHLDGPSGARLPVRYGPSAATYSLNAGMADAVAFDPAIPFTVSLPNSGRIQVNLGGTAMPTTTTPAGRYTAVITLTASAPGN